jgi:transposase-like protein
MIHSLYSKADISIQQLSLRCVLWYITYKLSYRDLRDMLAERGIDLAHTTILRWGQHYVPEFEKQWQRYLRPVGSSWHIDETYIRVKGRWTYLYKAVDKQSNTVERASRHRSRKALFHASN